MKQKELQAMAIIASMPKDRWKEAKVAMAHANRIINETPPGQAHGLRTIPAWLNARTAREKLSISNILEQAGAVIYGGDGREPLTIIFPKRKS